MATLIETLERAVQPPADGAEARAPSIPCKVALAVFDYAQRDYERWARMVRIFGWLTVITLVAAVGLFIVVDEQRAAAIVTFVIGLLEGGGVAFLRTERQTAAKERDKAQKKVDTQCEGFETEVILEQLTAPAAG